jgi:hypothetical protein
VTTDLGLRNANVFARLLTKYIVPLRLPLFMPFMNFLSTPKRAARVITKIPIDESGKTGVYYDQSGHPMQGSDLVRKPEFQDRVVAETRAFLSSV